MSMSGDIVHLVEQRRPRRVVITFPLGRRARRRLDEVLAAEFELVDVKVADGSEEIVLVPSTSRQLVGKIRAAFPDAALLVVEVQDLDFDVRLGGQVLRTLDAGADAYFAVRSIDELASIVDRASARVDVSEAEEPAALTSGSRDELSGIVDRLLRARQDASLARKDV